MDFYNKAKELLALNSEDIELDDIASADDIKAAESELEVVLPVSFKTFLQEIGGGDIGGEIIFSLTKEYKDDNFVIQTKKYRDMGLNHDYVVIARLDTLFYCLDVTNLDKDINKEGDVILVDEEFNKMETIASSFGEFLYMFLSQEALDEDEYI